jgi:hypothetical protein
MTVTTTTTTTQNTYNRVECMVTMYVPACLARMVKDYVHFRCADYVETLQQASRWTVLHKPLGSMSPPTKQSLALFLEQHVPSLEIVHAINGVVEQDNCTTCTKHWMEREACSQWEATVWEDERSRRYLRLTFKRDDQTGFMCTWRVACF